MGMNEMVGALILHQGGIVKGLMAFISIKHQDYICTHNEIS